MRKVFTVGAILLALLSGCTRGTENAPVQPSRNVSLAAVPKKQTNPAPFLSANDCFSKWPSYDAWFDSVKARNTWWNPKVQLLKYSFPRRDFELAQKDLDCASVTYENDGLTISGWRVFPRNHAGQKLPVLIYNRGGNGSFGAVTFPALLRNVMPYAHRGFLVLVSQYRGADEAHRERSGVDQFGGEDVRDVTRMIELAKAIPYADPDNIFMLGASRGAMMSFMAARGTHDVKAMAVIGGMSDLKHDLQYRLEMEQVYLARIPGYRTHKDQALAERSVLSWADELSPGMPVLILHGGDDERVHVSNATRLHRRLEELKRPHKLIIYRGDDHFLSAHRTQAIDEVVRWFHASMNDRAHVQRVARTRRDASSVPATHK